MWNQVGLPIHCKVIQTCCNAIQTLLKSNSNNSTNCDVFIYFSVRRFSQVWQVFAGFGWFQAPNSRVFAGYRPAKTGESRGTLVRN